MKNSFTFRWKETRSESFTVDIDKAVGVEVKYQPTGSSGAVKNKDGILVIEWEDNVSDTILDSDHGRSIIRECEVL